MWQSISCFSNPVPKFYFRYTIPSVYFLCTFIVLLPLCSQKYRSEYIFANSTADSLLQYSAFLSFVIIPHYLFAGFHSSEFVLCRRSPFLLAFIFFNVLVSIFLTLIRCDASTLVRLSQIRSKYNCNIECMVASQVKVQISMLTVRYSSETFFDRYCNSLSKQLHTPECRHQTLLVKLM